MTEPNEPSDLEPSRYVPPRPQMDRESSQYVEPSQPSFGNQPPPQFGAPPQYGAAPQFSAPPQFGPNPPFGEQPYQLIQYTPATYAQPPKPPRRGRSVALAAASVAVIVVAGAGISYVAFRDKSTGAGAATPQKAVALIVNDLTQSDILGVLDDLPPAERNALRDSFTDEVNQLKRLNVLNQAADPAKVSGLQVQASGLTFLPNDDVINDHVHIVQLTGGTIAVDSDASKVPYTKAFLDAAFPNGAPVGNTTNTVDIGAQVKKSGGPVRIAVEKVDGKWYPSLMYTIVDAANRDAGNPNPTAADAIAANGSASPDATVRLFIDAALKSDANAVIGLLDPDDSAALHEYGTQLTKGATPSDPDYTINDIDFSDTPVAGGTRVSLKSVTFTDADDPGPVTLGIDGDCVTVAADNHSQQFCSAKLFDEFAGGSRLTSADKAALSDLFKALPNIGIVTTEVGGKWYVSPIRSFADIGTDVLSGLADNDLITLIQLANQTR
jgi:hypothetical protein